MKKIVALILLSSFLVMSCPVFAEATLEDIAEGSTIDEIESDTIEQIALEDVETEVILQSDETPAEEKISGSVLTREYFDQSISQYAEEEANFSDPQRITDEEFFGVWDGSEWTTPSLLDYEGHPELFAIEMAAKEGNIPLAKEELLTYYAGKFENTDLGYSPTTSKNNINAARMYIESIITTHTVADVICLTDEYQDFSVNVTSLISGIESETVKKKEIQLLALRKDGNMGLFETKESENSPYIEITINNRTRTYYPVADTYIQAGTYYQDVNGDQSVMLTEESFSSIGSPMNSKADDYTKRSCLLFDFPDISSGDKITNATLRLRGMMIPSDNPIEPDSFPSYKDIVIASGSDLQWTDENMCWKNATTGDFISHNGEYNWEKKSPLALVDLSPGLRVYKGTGEIAYAYHTLRLLTTSIKYIFGTDYLLDDLISLAVSEPSTSMPNIIADITRLPCLTPEKFTLIMKYMYILSERAVKLWGSQEEGNNFGNINAAGCLIEGLVFPEFKAANLPLSDEPMKPEYPGGRTGGWKAVGEYRTLYMAKQSMFEDGSCIEVSQGYTKYILRSFARIFTISKGLGIDTKEVISKDVLVCLETYMIYLLDMSNPRAKGGGWQQGDAGSYQTDSYDRLAEIVEALDNPYVNWLYYGKKEGDEPDYLSVAYDVGQKAVLRSSWDTQAMALQINADSGYKSHGHSDDLAINLYAYGKMLLADPMQPDYDSTVPSTAWLYSTRAHNTIEINDTSQEDQDRGTGTDVTYTSPSGEVDTIYSSSKGTPGTLTPENREFNPMYNFLRAESNGYKNTKNLSDSFRMYRDVLFIEPEYFIVTDYLEPKTNQSAVNKYAQHWHSLPDANLTIDSETNVAKTNFMSGSNILIAPVEGSIDIDSSIKWGWYENGNTPNDYIKYVKRAPGKVTFNTVLYPVKAQENKEIVTKNLELDILEGEASAIAFSVTDKDTGVVKEAQYYNLHDLTKKGERTFGGYVTDSEQSFVQKIGSKLDKLIIRGGKTISETDGDNEKVLLESDTELKDLGIEWNLDELSLTTAEEDVDYTKIKIYAPDVKTVLINEKEVTFAKSGDYVIPTEEQENVPDIEPEPDEGDDEEEEEDEEGSGGKGSGSSGGSSGGGGKVKLPAIQTSTVVSGTPNLPKADAFSAEISGHWAEKEIGKMIEKGFVKGDDKGSLNLKNSITRAEFTALLVRALGLKGEAYSGEFSDVNQGDWFANELAIAKANGLFSGSDGKAMPNDVMTREQMAKLLTQAAELLGKTAEDKEITYIDAENMSDWAKEYVKKASSLCLLNGFEDGSFMPKGSVLREQAFVAIYRIIIFQN